MCIHFFLSRLSLSVASLALDDIRAILPSRSSLSPTSFFLPLRSLVHTSFVHLSSLFLGSCCIFSAELLSSYIVPTFLWYIRREDSILFFLCEIDDTFTQDLSEIQRCECEQASIYTE